MVATVIEPVPAVIEEPLIRKAGSPEVKSSSPVKSPSLVEEIPPSEKTPPKEVLSDPRDQLSKAVDIQVSEHESSSLNADSLNNDATLRDSEELPHDDDEQVCFIELGVSEGTTQSVPSRSDVIELSADIDVSGSKTSPVRSPARTSGPKTSSVVTTKSTISSLFSPKSVLSEKSEEKLETLSGPVSLHSDVMAKTQEEILDKSLASDSESAKEGVFKVGYQVTEPSVEKEISVHHSATSDTHHFESSEFHRMAQRSSTEWHHTVVHKPMETTELQVALSSRSDDDRNTQPQEGMVKTSFVQTSSGIQHVTRQVRLVQKKTVIRRRIVIINGVETVTEEVIDEPPEVSEFSSTESAELQPQIHEQVVEAVAPLGISQEGTSLQITSKETSCRSFSSTSFSVVEGNHAFTQRFESHPVERPVEKSTVIIEDVTEQFLDSENVPKTNNGDGLTHQDGVDNKLKVIQESNESECHTTEKDADKYPEELNEKKDSLGSIIDVLHDSLKQVEKEVIVPLAQSDPAGIKSSRIPIILPRDQMHGRSTKLSKLISSASDMEIESSAALDDDSLSSNISKEKRVLLHPCQLVPAEVVQMPDVSISVSHPSIELPKEFEFISGQESELRKGCDEIVDKSIEDEDCKPIGSETRLPDMDKKVKLTKKTAVIKDDSDRVSPQPSGRGLVEISQHSIEVVNITESPNLQGSSLEELHHDKSTKPSMEIEVKAVIKDDRKTKLGKKSEPGKKGLQKKMSIPAVGKPESSTHDVISISKQFIDSESSGDTAEIVISASFETSSTEISEKTPSESRPSKEKPEGGKTKKTTETSEETYKSSTSIKKEKSKKLDSSPEETQQFEKLDNSSSSNLKDEAAGPLARTGPPTNELMIPTVHDEAVELTLITADVVGEITPSAFLKKDRKKKGKKIAEDSKQLKGPGTSMAGKQTKQSSFVPSIKEKEKKSEIQVEDNDYCSQKVCEPKSDKTPGDLSTAVDDTTEIRLVTGGIQVKEQQMSGVASFKEDKKTESGKHDTVNEAPKLLAGQGESVFSDEKSRSSEFISAEVFDKSKVQPNDSSKVGGTVEITSTAEEMLTENTLNVVKVTPRKEKRKNRTGKEDANSRKFAVAPTKEGSETSQLVVSESEDKDEGLGDQVRLGAQIEWTTETRTRHTKTESIDNQSEEIRLSPKESKQSPDVDDIPRKQAVDPQNLSILRDTLEITLNIEENETGALALKPPSKKSRKLKGGKLEPATEEPGQSCSADRTALVLLGQPESESVSQANMVETEEIIVATSGTHKEKPQVPSLPTKKNKHKKAWKQHQPAGDPELSQDLDQPEIVPSAPLTVTKDILRETVEISSSTEFEFPKIPLSVPCKMHRKTDSGQLEPASEEMEKLGSPTVAALSGEQFSSELSVVGDETVDIMLTSEETRKEILESDKKKTGKVELFGVAPTNMQGSKEIVSGGTKIFVYETVEITSTNEQPQSIKPGCTQLTPSENRGDATVFGEQSIEVEQKETEHAKNESKKKRGKLEPLMSKPEQLEVSIKDASASKKQSKDEHKKLDITDETVQVASATDKPNETRDTESSPIALRKKGRQSKSGSSDLTARVPEQLPDLDSVSVVPGENVHNKSEAVVDETSEVTLTTKEKRSKLPKRVVSEGESKKKTEKVEILTTVSSKPENIGEKATDGTKKSLHGAVETTIITQSAKKISKKKHRKPEPSSDESKLLKISVETAPLPGKQPNCEYERPNIDGETVEVTITAEGNKTRSPVSPCSAAPKNNRQTKATDGSENLQTIDEPSTITEPKLIVEETAEITLPTEGKMEVSPTSDVSLPFKKGKKKKAGGKVDLLIESPSTSQDPVETAITRQSKEETKATPSPVEENLRAEPIKTSTSGSSLSEPFGKDKNKVYEKLEPATEKSRQLETITPASVPGVQLINEPMAMATIGETIEITLTTEESPNEPSKNDVPAPRSKKGKKKQLESVPDDRTTLVLNNTSTGKVSKNQPKTILSETLDDESSLPQQGGQPDSSQSAPKVKDRNTKSGQHEPTTEKPKQIKEPLDDGRKTGFDETIEITLSTEELLKRPLKNDVPAPRSKKGKKKQPGNVALPEDRTSVVLNTTSTGKMSKNQPKTILTESIDDESSALPQPGGEPDSSSSTPNVKDRNTKSVQHEPTTEKPKQIKEPLDDGRKTGFDETIEITLSTEELLKRQLKNDVPAPQSKKGKKKQPGNVALPEDRTSVVLNTTSTEKVSKNQSKTVLTEKVDDESSTLPQQGGEPDSSSSAPNVKDRNTKSGKQEPATKKPKQIKEPLDDEPNAGFDETIEMTLSTEELLKGQSKNDGPAPQSKKGKKKQPGNVALPEDRTSVVLNTTSTEKVSKNQSKTVLTEKVDDESSTLPQQGGEPDSSSSAPNVKDRNTKSGKQEPATKKPKQIKEPLDDEPNAGFDETIEMTLSTEELLKGQSKNDGPAPQSRKGKKKQPGNVALPEDRTSLVLSITSTGKESKNQPNTILSETLDDESSTLPQQGGQPDSSLSAPKVKDRNTKSGQHERTTEKPKQIKEPFDDGRKTGFDETIEMTLSTEELLKGPLKNDVPAPRSKKGKKKQPGNVALPEDRTSVVLDTTSTGKESKNQPKTILTETIDDESSASPQPGGEPDSSLSAPKVKDRNTKSGQHERTTEKPKQIKEPFDDGRKTGFDETIEMTLSTEELLKGPLKNDVPAPRSKKGKKKQPGNVALPEDRTSVVLDTTSTGKESKNQPKTILTETIDDESSASPQPGGEPDSSSLASNVKDQNIRSGKHEPAAEILKQMKEPLDDEPKAGFDETIEITFSTQKTQKPRSTPPTPAEREFKKPGKVETATGKPLESQCRDNTDEILTEHSKDVPQSIIHEIEKVTSGYEETQKLKIEPVPSKKDNKSDTHKNEPVTAESTPLHGKMETATVPDIVDITITAEVMDTAMSGSPSSMPLRKDKKKKPEKRELLSKKQFQLQNVAKAIPVPPAELTDKSKTMTISQESVRVAVSAGDPELAATKEPIELQDCHAKEVEQVTESPTDVLKSSKRVSKTVEISVTTVELQRDDQVTRPIKKGKEKQQQEVGKPIDKPNDLPFMDETVVVSSKTSPDDSVVSLQHDLGTKPPKDSDKFATVSVDKLKDSSKKSSIPGETIEITVYTEEKQKESKPSQSALPTSRKGRTKKPCKPEPTTDELEQLEGLNKTAVVTGTDEKEPQTSIVSSDAVNVTAIERVSSAPSAKSKTKKIDPVLGKSKHLENLGVTSSSPVALSQNEESQDSTASATCTQLSEKPMSLAGFDDASLTIELIQKEKISKNDKRGKKLKPVELESISKKPDQNAEDQQLKKTKQLQVEFTTGDELKAVDEAAKIILATDQHQEKDSFQSPSSSKDQKLMKSVDLEFVSKEANQQNIHKSAKDDEKQVPGNINVSETIDVTLTERKPVIAVPVPSKKESKKKGRKPKPGSLESNSDLNEPGRSVEKLQPMILTIPIPITQCTQVSVVTSTPGERDSASYTASHEESDSASENIIEITANIEELSTDTTSSTPQVRKPGIQIEEHSTSTKPKKGKRADDSTAVLIETNKPLKSTKSKGIESTPTEDSDIHGVLGSPLLLEKDQQTYRTVVETVTVSTGTVQRDRQSKKGQKKAAKVSVKADLPPVTDRSIELRTDMPSNSSIESSVCQQFIDNESSLMYKPAQTDYKRNIQDIPVASADTLSISVQELSDSQVISDQPARNLERESGMKSVDKDKKGKSKIISSQQHPEFLDSSEESVSRNDADFKALDASNNEKILTAIGLVESVSSPVSTQSSQYLLKDVPLAKSSSSSKFKKTSKPSTQEENPLVQNSAILTSDRKSEEPPVLENRTDSTDETPKAEATLNTEIKDIESDSTSELPESDQQLVDHLTVTVVSRNVPQTLKGMEATTDDGSTAPSTSTEFESSLTTSGKIEIILDACDTSIENMKPIKGDVVQPHVKKRSKGVPRTSADPLSTDKKGSNVGKEDEFETVPVKKKQMYKTPVPQPRREKTKKRESVRDRDKISVDSNGEITSSNSNLVETSDNLGVTAPQNDIVKTHSSENRSHVPIAGDSSVLPSSIDNDSSKPDASGLAGTVVETSRLNEPLQNVAEFVKAESSSPKSHYAENQPLDPLEKYYVSDPLKTIKKKKKSRTSTTVLPFEESVVATVELDEICEKEQTTTWKHPEGDFEITVTTAVEEESSEISSDIPVRASRAKQKRGKKPRPSILDPSQWQGNISTLPSKETPALSALGLSFDARRDRSKSPSYADVLANRQDQPVSSFGTHTLIQVHELMQDSEKSSSPSTSLKYECPVGTRVIFQHSESSYLNPDRSRPRSRSPRLLASSEGTSVQNLPGSSLVVQQRRERSKSPSYASVASGFAAAGGDFWHPDESEQQTYVSNIEVWPDQSVKLETNVGSTIDKIVTGEQVVRVTEISRTTPLREEGIHKMSSSKARNRQRNKKSKGNLDEGLPRGVVMPTSEQDKSIEKESEGKLYYQEPTPSDCGRGKDNEGVNLSIGVVKSMDESSDVPIPTFSKQVEIRPICTEDPHLNEPVIYKKDGSQDELIVTHPSPSSGVMTLSSLYQKRTQPENVMGQTIVIPPKDEAADRVEGSTDPSVRSDDSSYEKSQEGELVVSVSIRESDLTDSSDSSRPSSSRTRNINKTQRGHISCISLSESPVDQVISVQRERERVTEVTISGPKHDHYSLEESWHGGVVESSTDSAAVELPSQHLGNIDNLYPTHSSVEESHAYVGETANRQYIKPPESLKNQVEPVLQLSMSHISADKSKKEDTNVCITVDLSSGLPNQESTEFVVGQSAVTAQSKQTGEAVYKPVPLKEQQKVGSDFSDALSGELANQMLPSRKETENVHHEQVVRSVSQDQQGGNRSASEDKSKDEDHENIRKTRREIEKVRREQDARTKPKDQQGEDRSASGDKSKDKDYENDRTTRKEMETVHHEKGAGTKPKDRQDEDESASGDKSKDNKHVNDRTTRKEMEKVQYEHGAGTKLKDPLDEDGSLGRIEQSRDKSKADGDENVTVPVIEWGSFGPTQSDKGKKGSKKGRPDQSTHKASKKEGDGVPTTVHVETITGVRESYDVKRDKPVEQSVRFLDDQSNSCISQDSKAPVTDTSVVELIKDLGDAAVLCKDIPKTVCVEEEIIVRQSVGLSSHPTQSSSQSIGKHFAKEGGSLDSLRLSDSFICEERNSPDGTRCSTSSEDKDTKSKGSSSNKPSSITRISPEYENDGQIKLDTDMVKEGKKKAPPDKPSKQSLPEGKTTSRDLVTSSSIEIPAEISTHKGKKSKSKSKQHPGEQLDFDVNISISAKLSDPRGRSSSSSHLPGSPLVTANITGKASVTPGRPTKFVSDVPPAETDSSLETSDSAASSIPESSDASLVISEQIESPSHSAGTLGMSRYEDASFIESEAKHTLPPLVVVDPRAARNEERKLLTETAIATMKDAVSNPEETSFRYYLSSPDLDRVYRGLEENIKLLEASNSNEYEETRMICVTTITEYLETILYIIVNTKKSIFNGGYVPDHKLAQLKKLQEELDFLKKNIPLVCHDPNDPVLAELENQRSIISHFLTETTTLATKADGKWKKYLDEVQKVCDSLNALNVESSGVDGEKIDSFVETLDKLDALEKQNSIHKFELMKLIKNGRKLSCPPFRVLPQSLVVATHMASSIEDHLIHLRNQVEQAQMLSKEYRDTLVELEHVTNIAQRIVDSRVMVNSLSHLQEEMQKGRKFFVSLSHCRSILESLEEHLDRETKLQHADLHKKLHSAASDILDRAGDRIGVLALAASRWTIVEQGLAEEAKWLQVAHQRAPCLTGVSTSEYEQYISVYQALSTDLDLHSGRVWKLLNSAHSLQSVISCPSLEESCDSLREQLSKLREKVNEDEMRLLNFKEVWVSFETVADKIEQWIAIVRKDKKLRKSPVDITRYWELKAEYEYYKQLLVEINTKFELAISTLPVSDEVAQRNSMAQLADRWAIIEKLMLDAETALYSSLQPGADTSRPEQILILEKRVEEIESAFGAMHGVINTDDQLQLYLGKIQVLLDSLASIQEDISRISLGPSGEMQRFAKLQQTTKALDDTLKNQIQGITTILERLGVLRKGINRLMRDQLRALAVLDQCQNSLDMDDPDVRQALVNTKGVCKALAEQWSDLLALRQDLHSIPLGIKASVNLSNYEREISKIQDSHAGLESRANALVAALEARTGLWDDYNDKLDTVKGSVREAEYMMDMLKVQGPLDYNRLVKATNRLKGVQETFEEREPTLEELREAERVLEKVVREEVGARLRGEVEEQEEAWKCTQTELVQLVTSYTKAARLWSTYATASKQLDLQPNHSLQEWNERKGKVAELEKLAEEISGEVGVEVLKPEVSALARRLEDSQVNPPDTSQTTTDPAVQLEDINKNLKKIDVRGSDPTRQLNDLLDHLTALGRTEANLSTVSKKSSDNLQIIQLLQVWERIFRETFQEYHRLSSRLVQTEERTIVLNLWQDYLNHINQLLNSNPSQHYEDLHEQNQLFKVHRDVLGCQKFLLSAQMASGDVSIIEKLSLLTNLHNETLSKIMEKQSEIQSRIVIWDEYREDQAALLEWLKNIESERNKLKLRYITLGTLKKTMYHIEDLLERLNEGNSKEQNLHSKLSELVKCCDESLSNSLRVEFTSISHRLSNLKAALSTWKDHLSKVLDKSVVYEKQFNQVHSDLVEIQNHLSDESCRSVERIPFEGLQLKLAKLQNVSRLVDDSLGGIKKLKEAEESLTDSVSPSDIKNMSQKCWLLEQQQCDLALQLSLANQAIVDRIQLSELFDKRFDRFISWTKDVTERLDRITKLDAGQALKRLETEIHAEVSLHKREVDWLAVTGRELLSVECENSSRGSLLVKNLEVLSQTWQGVLSDTDGHASKLRSIVQSMSQLEMQMSDLRVSLQEIESKLLSPIILEETTKKCVDKLQDDHQELQAEIEQKTSSVSEVLNIFELLINDCAACNISVDTDGISMAMNNLEKRWKNICIASSERKTLISQLWTKVQRIFQVSKERRKSLQKVNKELSSLEKQLDDSSKSSIDSISQTSSLCKAMEKDLRKMSGDCLVILEDLYRQLLLDYSLPNELLAIPEELMDIEKSLMDRAQKCGQLASTRAAQFEKFVKYQNRSLTALVKIDAMLTIAELRDNSGGDLSTPEALAAYISKLENSLQAETDNLREADFLGLEVMKWCLPHEVDKVQGMIDEYQKLWKDVTDRLATLKANKETKISSKTLADVGVEANTLKFETDQCTQVDTLGWSGPMRRKDAFISELQKTCNDFEFQIKSLAQLDRLDTHKKISKYVGKCESTYELAKHLSDTLMEQCSANVSEALVDKLNRLRAEFNKVRILAQQKQSLLKETSAHGKQSCPVCSERNWHQLETDLWRLEQCIQFAEGTLSSQPSTLPTSLEPLEIIIQDQRELLQTLDSHRSLLLSMNDVGTHLAEHSDGDERANDFRGRLAVMNQRWDIICENAASSQARLQTALIQNEEFHETINELTEWLERTEVNIRQSEPIDLNESRDIIEAKYEKFKDLKVELERCEPRIVSLEEAARQVLSDTTEVSCKRLSRLRLRLHSLIRLTNHYLLVILSAFPMLSDEESRDGSLETTSSSPEESNETSTLVRCNRFFGRVVRASVPISAFLLLLLGAATLIPQTQPDFACTGSLTFAPVLRFPNGLPPV